jgi:hypothetical protein
MGRTNQRRTGLKAGSVILTIGICGVFTAGGLAWVQQGRVHQELGERITKAERRIRDLKSQLVDDERELAQLTSWASLRLKASALGLTEVPAARRIFIPDRGVDANYPEPAPVVAPRRGSRPVDGTIAAAFPH